MVSGWRSQSEPVAQLPDAMSHTTSGKVLTDRQQGRKGGRVEEAKRGGGKQHLVQNCLPSSGLKATAPTTRPPPACTGGPKQRGNTTRQHVIFNSHRTVRLGFVQKGFENQGYISLMRHRQKKKYIKNTRPYILIRHIRHIGR